MLRFDVFVIGGGGTGSEVAFQLGRRSSLRVAIAERDRLGGECNHYGCVPTKVMLRSARIAQLAREADRFGVLVPSVDVDLGAVQRRARDVVETMSGAGAEPFERLGVTLYLQEARLVGDRVVELADGTQIRADRIVLATGTRPAVPPIPGLAEGPYWTNREAIWKPDRPPATLAVIGTGAVGVEFSQIYARLGSRVTAIEVLPTILPEEDVTASEALAPALRAEGIRVLAGIGIERATFGPDGWELALANGQSLRADEVLVATGRLPVFDGHDLAAAGVDLDDHGRPVLSETLRTTADGVWAAGDATGDLLFTHVGDYEAGVVVDDVLGASRPRDYRVVPRVTFCDPEVASVGLAEHVARELGHDVRTATVPLLDNERARIDGATFGVVKLVGDAATGELLGGHIVGEQAGAMIHEVVAAMAARVRADRIGDAIHAYPTPSESVRDAFRALALALGEGRSGVRRYPE